MRGDWSEEQLDGYRDDIIVGRDVDTLKASRLWVLIERLADTAAQDVFDADPGDSHALQNAAYTARAMRELLDVFEIAGQQAATAAEIIAEEQNNE